MRDKESLVSSEKALKWADSFVVPTDTKYSSGFHFLFQTTVKFLGLSDKDIAHHFGVSRVTVSRWKNGINAPRSVAMQSVVLDWLLECIQEALLSGASLNAKDEEYFRLLLRI